MTAPVGKGVYCIMTCRVLRIDEQLYGCEELPAGQPVLCDVLLADAAGTDTPVVTDFMIWGGHPVAENAFFLRYHDQDADAHALQVWRTEDHADDEAV